MQISACPPHEMRLNQNPQTTATMRSRPKNLSKTLLIPAFNNNHKKIGDETVALHTRCHTCSRSCSHSFLRSSTIISSKLKVLEIHSHEDDPTWDDDIIENSRTWAEFNLEKREVLERGSHWKQNRRGARMNEIWNWWWILKRGRPLVFPAKWPLVKSPFVKGPFGQRIDHSSSASCPTIRFSPRDRLKMSNTLTPLLIANAVTRSIPHQKLAHMAARF